MQCLNPGTYSNSSSTQNTCTRKQSDLVTLGVQALPVAQAYKPAVYFTATLVFCTAAARGHAALRLCNARPAAAAGAIVWCVLVAPATSLYQC